MSTTKKRREITPDPPSFDSFPIMTEDSNSMDSDDIVVRAAKKRKLEEEGQKATRHPVFQHSQSPQVDEAGSNASAALESLAATVTIPITETIVIDSLSTTAASGRISRNNTTSLDILSDPSFSFPPGPIREDSLPIILTYEIDDED